MKIVFNPGDKIVCVNNLNTFGGVKLTFNKIYDVVDISYSAVSVKDDNNLIKQLFTQYKIMDDNGEKYWYNVTRFISLQEYRKLKLNKICM